jgi:hypothetical protein
VTLDEATHRFGTIRRTWLDDPSIAANIERNCDVLLRGHDDFFKAVRELEVRHQSIVSSKEESLATLNTVEKSNQDLTHKLTRVAQDDDFFIRSLSCIDSGLDEVSVEVAGASKVCLSDAQGSIESLATAISEVRQSLKRMRAYVAEAREKRLHLLKALHHFYKSRVAHRAKMLTRVFKVDVTKFPSCGRDLSKLAAVTDPMAARRYLKHASIPHDAPARVPLRSVQGEFEFEYAPFPTYD